MKSPVYKSFKKARNKSNNKLGAGTFFFIYVGLPFLLFAAVLAVDVTKTVIVYRQVTNVADASALAGSFQFEGQSAQLDVGRAQLAAIETFSRATTGDTRVTGIATRSTDAVVAPDRQSITMQVRYQVPNLVLLPFLEAFLGERSEAGSKIYTVTREAFICIPGDAERPTEGFCQRPKDF